MRPRCHISAMEEARSMDTRTRFAGGALTGVLLWASVTGAQPRGIPNDCSTSAAVSIDGQAVGIDPSNGTGAGRADDRTNHGVQRPATTTPSPCPSGAASEAAHYNYPYHDPYV